METSNTSSRKDKHSAISRVSALIQTGPRRGRGWDRERLARLFNSIVPSREDQKMDSEIEKTILASERKSGRLEDRLAALESTVNFLVTQMSEGRGPIKSEPQLFKQSRDAAGPYDSWPHDPMEW